MNIGNELLLAIEIQKNSDTTYDNLSDKCKSLAHRVLYFRKNEESKTFLLKT